MLATIIAKTNKQRNKAKLEHVLEELELVIEHLKLDSKRYIAYIPTILTHRCSYFPSSGDEEVVDDESQSQMVVADKISILVASITDDTLHYELADRVFCSFLSIVHIISCKRFP